MREKDFVIRNRRGVVGVVSGLRRRGMVIPHMQPGAGVDAVHPQIFAAIPTRVSHVNIERQHEQAVAAKTFGADRRSFSFNIGVKNRILAGTNANAAPPLAIHAPFFRRERFPDVSQPERLREIVGARKAGLHANHVRRSARRRAAHF